MKLPPLMGVPLKLDTFTVWAVHLGPDAVAPEWSRDAALTTMSAATNPCVIHHFLLLSVRRVWGLNGKSGNMPCGWREATIDGQPDRRFAPDSPLRYHKSSVSL